MEQSYHNQCTKCPDTFWTEDAWKELCPFCEVEDGTQVIEYLTASEIIARFSEELTLEQMEIINQN